MTTAGPAGTVIGYDPNDLKVAADTSGAAAKTLADAYAAGGDAATRLKTVTAQIRALEQVSSTGGLYGQITAGPLRDLLNSAGFGNITDGAAGSDGGRQSAQEHAARDAERVRHPRFAKPEIDLMGQVTGSAQLPPGVLNNILANVDATADYTIKRRGLAGQALGYDPSNPMNYPGLSAAGQRPARPVSGQRRQAAAVLQRDRFDAAGVQLDDGPGGGPGESIRGFLERALACLRRRELASGLACSRAAPAGGFFVGSAGDEERPVGSGDSRTVRCRSTSLSATATSSTSPMG